MKISIDGVAGSGKSTISKKLADNYNLRYINTGKIYRLIAYACKVKFPKIYINYSSNLISISPFKELSNIDIIDMLNYMRKLNISFNKNGDIIANSLSFEQSKLLGEEVAKVASKLASIKEVRDFADSIQIEIAKFDNIIMEGRDIGSKILKNDESVYKIYLSVNPKNASERRYSQLQKEIKKSDDFNSAFKKKLDKVKIIQRQMEERNHLDSNRKYSPLIVDKESYDLFVDTNEKSLIDVIAYIINNIDNK